MKGYTSSSLQLMEDNKHTIDKHEDDSRGKTDMRELKIFVSSITKYNWLKMYLHELANE